MRRWGSAKPALGSYAPALLADFYAGRPAQPRADDLLYCDPGGRGARLLRQGCGSPHIWLEDALYVVGCARGCDGRADPVFMKEPSAQLGVEARWPETDAASVLAAVEEQGLPFVPFLGYGSDHLFAGRHLLVDALVSASRGGLFGGSGRRSDGADYRGGGLGGTAIGGMAGAGVVAKDTARRSTWCLRSALR